MTKCSIGEHPLFAGVPVDWVEKFLQKFPSRVCREGDLIVRQGDKAENFYLIVDGKTEVFTQAADGERYTLLFQQAPDITGELELWSGKNYLANVEAIEPCTIISMGKKDFHSLLHSNHQVCINMIRIITDIFYTAAKGRRMDSFGSAEQRLANTLLSLAELYGEAHDYGILIREEINKSKLAQMVGVSRQSIIRDMESLQKQELISMQGKKVIIPSLRALKEKTWQSILGSSEE